MSATFSEVPTFAEIEAELQSFEAAERRRLGLGAVEVERWRDPNPQTFARDERGETTILVGGLTCAHDGLVQAALQGVGYRVEVLDCPDTRALHLGKEFGNRGQCNPTYFTVGNLIQRLTHLRDQEGLTVREITARYVFVTAGACGPCRFGTYATEYRKALRDAGFDGFRVFLFQQTGGLTQALGAGGGLVFTPQVFLQLVKAFVAGDIINALGYRLRPYEVHPGATDAALQQVREVVGNALRQRSSMTRALRRCRGLLSQVEVNRLQPRPLVMIIGEFWAMTTEGDGNYRLQRFLEAEGAEVYVQPLTAWLLYLIWQTRHDVRRRLSLSGADPGRRGLAGKSGRWLLLKLWLAESGLRLLFGWFARSSGLAHYPLADLQEIADLAQAHYDVELRGGEGHMEVGKLIECVQKNKAHLVISVKPFGCMPSSGVSDGIQSAVLARHPEAAFCAVETTGDGEVNFQSRVQMYLFKARQRARDEFQRVLKDRGLSESEAEQRLLSRGLGTLDQPRHIVAGTGANQLYEL